MIFSSAPAISTYLIHLTKNGPKGLIIAFIIILTLDFVTPVRKLSRSYVHFLFYSFPFSIHPKDCGTGQTNIWEEGYPPHPTPYKQSYLNLVKEIK